MLLTLLITLSLASDPPMEDDITSLPKIPERIGYWHHTPAIKICKNSLVTPKQVKESYSIFGVDVEPEIIPPCGCDLMPSEIRFVPAKCVKEWNPEEKRAYYGYTSISYYAELKMLLSVGVSVIVPDNAVVLTHEVGHSLGWMHSCDSDHLMFPFYGRMTNSLTIGMTKE